MIRVRDLELQPDGPRLHLNANIRLVASYQKIQLRQRAPPPGRFQAFNQNRKMKTTTLILILFLTALAFLAQPTPNPRRLPQRVNLATNALACPAMPPAPGMPPAAGPARQRPPARLDRRASGPQAVRE